MINYKHLVLACVLLAACDGNPFLPDEDPIVVPPPVVPVVPDGGINGVGAPVTTGTPSRERTIVRREKKDVKTGDGFVADVTFTPATGTTPETFSVDGLPFDGGNVYSRDNQIGSLGPFAVYEADPVFNDSVTGVPITQFVHRAIYGVSRTGRTEFAIVRTGAFRNFGFGGFVYQRNGSVTLPTGDGQASYTGDYAGLRDFDGSDGLEYTTGTMTVDIDFNDFNEGDAVRGRIYDRAILDINGQDITLDVVTALNEKNESNLVQLPTLLFNVGPGALDANGEVGGVIDSATPTSTSAAELYEEGNFYAVISGDATAGGNDEIVGVIVIESKDPRVDKVTVRETGGFLLYRSPTAP